MASKLMNIHPIFSFLLLLLVCVLSVSATASFRRPINSQLIFFPQLSDALAKKGYFYMSLVLDLALAQVLETYPSYNITGLTLFVPNDKAFSPPKYMDPPLPLLQYHAVPFKIQRETIESAPCYSKIDTLLQDRLIVTSTPHPHDGEASINSVKITQWNLYDDSNILIHGIEEFFDPKMAILFPSNKPGILNPIDNAGIHQKSLALRTLLKALEYLQIIKSQIIVWVASSILISVLLFITRY